MSRVSVDLYIDQMGMVYLEPSTEYKVKDRMPRMLVNISTITSGKRWCTALHSQSCMTMECSVVISLCTPQATIIIDKSKTQYAHVLTSQHYCLN